MICAYCNGEVPKEEAIKDGRYYHKRCHRQKMGKREIEEFWLKEINRGTVLALLRKVIKEVAEIYDVDYVLWVLKESKIRKINLQYPAGLKNMLDQQEFKEGYKKLKARAEYNKIKDDIVKGVEEDVSFKYIPSKKITDLI